MVRLKLVLGALAVAADPVSAAVIANQPYRCFDRASDVFCDAAVDSPFAGKDYNYFILASFESGIYDAFGLSTQFKNPFSRVIGANELANSVDGHRDMITGGRGHTLRIREGSNPNPADRVALFGFDRTLFGDALPTDVGFVWARGDGDFTFEFFDGAGGLLGSTSANLAGDGNLYDQHRFFGWTGDTGVGSFRITGPSSFQIDHIQFGQTTLQAVPEPATWAMMIVGFGAVGYSLRRRRTEMRLPEAI